MKLSLATLSLAVASVKGSSLRFNNKKNVAARGSDDNILASEIVLKGVVGKPTAQDIDFIGQALVSSYNNVHWEVGHYLTGDRAVKFVGPDSIMCNLCPDDDSMGGATADVFSVNTPVGIMCNLCPDDDSMGAGSLLMTAITEDCAGLCKKDAVAELEVNFCNKIQSVQGSKYLNSAQSCSIFFDTEAAEKKHQKQVSKNASNKVATIDSTLILKGVSGDVTSKADQAIIAKAFVSAYNDVHWNSDHYLADAEIPFSAGTSADPGNIMCNLCPDDDSMGGAAMTKTMVLDIVTPVVGIMCNLCPDDDSMGSRFDLESLNAGSAFNKKAVEVAFCKKLQNSASDKLSATKSCSIAVVESVAAAAANNAEAKMWW